MKLKDTRGSALMVVLIIVVLAALGGAGYWVWHKNKNTSSTQTSSSTNQSSSQSTTSPSPSPSPQGTIANPCGDLTLSKGTSEGTAGTIYWHVVVTNNSSLGCKLSGYPTASASDGTMSQTVEKNPLYPKVNVTLAANGGKAHVVLGLPDPNNFPTPNTECTVAAKTKLTLVFAGVPSGLDLGLKDRDCTGSTVTTIQPGA